MHPYCDHRGPMSVPFPNLCQLSTALRQTKQKLRDYWDKNNYSWQKNGLRNFSQETWWQLYLRCVFQFPPQSQTFSSNSSRFQLRISPCVKMWHFIVGIPHAQRHSILNTKTRETFRIGEVQTAIFQDLCVFASWIFIANNKVETELEKLDQDCKYKLFLPLLWLLAHQFFCLWDQSRFDLQIWSKKCSRNSWYCKYPDIFMGKIFKVARNFATSIYFRGCFFFGEI